MQPNQQTCLPMLRKTPINAAVHILLRLSMPVRRKITGKRQLNLIMVNTSWLSSDLQFDIN
jgi:hypothetical protein